MIFLDTTKAANSRHHSGLIRVTSRLVRDLADGATAGDWTHARTAAAPGDWFFTAELFSERERPGFSEFLASGRCRTAALFHDAIPLKLPHITWPQSVARHPEYLKLLARFDRVFAVSRASKAELEGFWRWVGLERTPPIDVLTLGADFAAQPRPGSGGRPDRHNMPPRPKVLCVGIIEPRKNQGFLLAVAERLWTAGEDFELHFVGRLNPHFGEPVARQIKQAARRWRGRVFHHDAISDTDLLALYAEAQLTAFPTIAEGCGLPLLESLWMGVPCLCSDLPVLRENADAGGCVTAPVNDVEAWTAALTCLLRDDGYYVELCQGAQTRPLPTWASCANSLRQRLLA